MNNSPIKSGFKQHLESLNFLSESKIKFIVNQIMNVPKSFLDEEKEWWNYYSINNSFEITSKDGWVFPSRIFIPKTQKYLKSNKRTIKVLPLELFTSQYDEKHTIESHIIYTSSNEKSKSIEEPIIILKEFHGGLRVIDGNHRISNAILSHKTSISAQIINEEELFSSDLFSSHYNKMTRKAFQIFVNELDKSSDNRLI